MDVDVKGARPLCSKGARPLHSLTIGLVAGESSGDNLGAALMAAIGERAPGTRFVGIAGPRMQAAGCETLAHAEELAVMGLFEVLHHLPRLLALRSRIRGAMLERRPDAFVGIDAPEFNLGLAPALHAAGLRTVQYVSPQVWAWRRGRAARMARFLDLVLCLLPLGAAATVRAARATSRSVAPRAGPGGRGPPAGLAAFPDPGRGRRRLSAASTRRSACARSSSGIRSPTSSRSSRTRRRHGARSACRTRLAS